MTDMYIYVCMFGNQIYINIGFDIGKNIGEASSNVWSVRVGEGAKTK